MLAVTDTTVQPAAKPKRGNDNNPQPLHVAQLADALLRIKTAAHFSGMSEATLYRKAKTDPTFPKLVKLGARCTRIRAGDFTAWLNSKVPA